MSEIVDRNDLADHLPEDTFINEVMISFEANVYWNFKKTLNSAKNERPLQAFIEQNPKILAALMIGHLGRWVVPQKRLGSEYVTDFIVGDLSSYGFKWVAVELESPTAPLFSKNGDPSAKLSHAIRQIQDWRSWLADNRSYAQRKTSRGGLGLFGIRSRLPGFIFIGRRNCLADKDKNLRAQMSEDLNIEICTYDRLLGLCAYYSGLFDEIPDYGKRRHTLNADACRCK